MTINSNLKNIVTKHLKEKNTYKKLVLKLWYSLCYLRNCKRVKIRFYTTNKPSKYPTVLQSKCLCCLKCVYIRLAYFCKCPILKTNVMKHLVLKKKFIFKKPNIGLRNIIKIALHSITSRKAPNFFLFLSSFQCTSESVQSERSFTDTEQFFS